MKKIVAFLFAVMAVVLLNTPLTGTAKAAKVAVVPIQVNEQEVERAGDFNSYYWDIIINKLEYPEFELLDEDVINVTLKKHIKDSDTMVSFIKSLTIANQTDLDSVKDAVRSFMYKTKVDGNDENKEFLNNFLMNGEVVNLTYTDMGLIYYKKYKPIPTEIDRFLEIIKNNKNPLKYIY